MKLVHSPLAFAAVLALSGPAFAVDADLAACAGTGAALETIAKKYPELSEPGIKPRLALVFIGTAAATAQAYMGDAGWSEEEQAPIAALLALRDGPADGAEPPAKDEIPGLVVQYTHETAAMLAEKCTMLPPPDLSALPAPSGE